MEPYWLFKVRTAGLSRPAAGLVVRMLLPMVVAAGMCPAAGAQDLDSCAEGIVYDDGEFETSYRTEAAVQSFAQRFDLPTGHRTLGALCVCLAWEDLEPGESLELWLTLWRDDGPEGKAGTRIDNPFGFDDTLRFTLPTRGLPTSGSKFFSIDIDRRWPRNFRPELLVAGDAVHVGITWRDERVSLCADESPTTALQSGSYDPDPAAGPAHPEPPSTPLEEAFPGHRAVGIRARFDDQPPGCDAREFPLKKLDARHFVSEHGFYLIPEPGTVDWPNYHSLYSEENLERYRQELQQFFPDDYDVVAVFIGGLEPNRVPSWVPRRFKGTGIGLDFGTPGIPDYCLCHEPRAGSFDLGVFDHELGHYWGAFVAPQDGEGHWRSDSTVQGQMGGGPTIPGGLLGRRVRYYGARNGYTWDAWDDFANQMTERYSPQQLYLMGLLPEFPDAFTFRRPVRHPDGTVTSQRRQRIDHASLVRRQGPRRPDYTKAPRQIRIAFVYVARDESEIQEALPRVETEVPAFVYGEDFVPCAVGQTDPLGVPVLAATRLGMTLDARLTDLDGNASPTIELAQHYLQVSEPEVALDYVASDDGSTPRITVIGHERDTEVTEDRILVRGLLPGTHNLTVKAQDAGGKRAFAHAVVDVAESGCIPDRQVLCLEGGRFRVRARWRSDTTGPLLDFGFPEVIRLPDEGPGRAVRLTDDTGAFWFFDSANLEVIVKVINACSVPNVEAFWVFAAGLTNVHVELDVTDTASEETQTYVVPKGPAFAPLQDVSAFRTCDAEPQPAAAVAMEVPVAGPVRFGGRVEQGGSATCEAGLERLCLNGGRFAVEAQWKTHAGNEGTARADPIAADTGSFWFFDEDNLEILVKVLDACDLEGFRNVWVFAAGLTNVEVLLQVTDTVSGETHEWTNDLGAAFQPIQETGLFADSCLAENGP